MHRLTQAILTPCGMASNKCKEARSKKTIKNIHYQHERLGAVQENVKIENMAHVSWWLHKGLYELIKNININDFTYKGEVCR